MSVFLCFFKYKGVHLQLSLQINGTEAKQQSSQILKAFLFRFGLKKVAVEKWGKNYGYAFFPSMGFVFPHLCRNRVVEKNSRIPWPFRNRNVAVEGWEIFWKLLSFFCPACCGKRLRGFWQALKYAFHVEVCFGYPHKQAFSWLTNRRELFSRKAQKRLLFWYPIVQTLWEDFLSSRFTNRIRLSRYSGELLYLEN